MLMDNNVVVGDHRRRFDIVKVIAAAEAIAILGLVIALVASRGGSSTVSQPTNSQKQSSKSSSPAQTYGVCSDDITKFNNVYTDSEIGTDDFKNRMKSVANEAMRRDGAADDATCLFIDFKYQITAFNVDGAQKDYDKLKSLAAKGLYPSNDLTTISSMKDMQTDIDSINQSLKTDDDASRKGIG